MRKDSIIKLLMGGEGKKRWNEVRERKKERRKEREKETLTEV